MKFILILVVMNLTDPSDPSMLAHKAYNSQIECEAAVEALPTPPANLRLASFCVQDMDLLELTDA